MSAHIRYRSIPLRTLLDDRALERFIQARRLRWAQANFNLLGQ